ncbi:hypothetical protein [Frigoribacterium sp. CFBP 8766]|uniref:hypothetical protein n=1 Tax=Frigoribacterium sp. CFBP 8766 TaxID=2775273 RepID=UPI0018FECB5F|nr:hypothetical protein [Frigoribacterium sp. CFBP 8766]
MPLTSLSSRSASRRRALTLPAAALGIVLVATGCQQVQTADTAATSSREDISSAPIGDATIVEGGDLVMALSAEPDRLDPTRPPPRPSTRAT